LVYIITSKRKSPIEIGIDSFARAILYNHSNTAVNSAKPLAELLESKKFADQSHRCIWDW
jgi:hypothetical protein